MDGARATRFSPVSNPDALDGWLPRAGAALLFLHDPGCGASRRAHAEVARVGGEAVLVDVRAHPSMAGEVERRTGVRHESPQAIVLRGGRVAWAASHTGVTAGAVAAALRAAARRPRPSASGSEIDNASP